MLDNVATNYEKSEMWCSQEKYQQVKTLKTSNLKFQPLGIYNYYE